MAQQAASNIHLRGSNEDAWELRDAIDRTCKENPGAYMRAVLSLVPKDFALTAEKDETPQCIEIRFVD